jgi:hypothetical protein
MAPGFDGANLPAMAASEMLNRLYPFRNPCCQSHSATAWRKVASRKRSLEQGSIPMPTDVSDLRAQKISSTSWFAETINDPNLVATVLFCVAGLLITAVVMLRFPDLGLTIAQYNQF